MSTITRTCTHDGSAHLARTSCTIAIKQEVDPAAKGAHPLSLSPAVLAGAKRGQVTRVSLRTCPGPARAAHLSPLHRSRKRAPHPQGFAVLPRGGGDSQASRLWTREAGPGRVGTLAPAHSQLHLRGNERGCRSSDRNRGLRPDPPRQHPHDSLWRSRCQARGERSRIVYNWHNIESEAMRRFSATVSSPAKRWYARLTASKLASLEQEILKTAFGHVVCSVRELEATAAHCALGPDRGHRKRGRCGRLLSRRGRLTA